MSISLKFYLDANLSTPVNGSLIFEQATDGSSGPQTKVIYMGSSVPQRKFESANNSGVSPIVVSVLDGQPGIGQEASSIKLALDPNNLAAAVPGAPLQGPATLLSGVINAIPIYIQAKDSTGRVGIDNSLSLVTNNIIETKYVP